ncbi:MAG: hypothetical protein MN733_35780 [Nitrososphaera sp.]|nr:hypothetical protein [Nitrososphaera sp.]
MKRPQDRVTHGLEGISWLWELHVLGQRFAVIERELELIKYLLMTRYGPGHQIAQRVAKLPSIVKRAKAKLAQLFRY